MKKEKPKTTLSEFIIGLGVSAGMLGLMGMVFKDQMKKLQEMMNMDGVSVREVIAGMVSIYNELLEEKNAEIKELEQTVSRKDADISALKIHIEADAENISELLEKVKELKSGKKKDKKPAKKEPSKEEKPEPKLV